MSFTILAYYSSAFFWNLDHYRLMTILYFCFVYNYSYITFTQEKKVSFTFLLLLFLFYFIFYYFFLIFIFYYYFYFIRLLSLFIAYLRQGMVILIMLLSKTKNQTQTLLLQSWTCGLRFIIFCLFFHFTGGSCVSMCGALFQCFPIFSFELAHMIRSILMCFVCFVGHSDIFI